MMKNEKISLPFIVMFGLTAGFVMLDRQGIAYLFPALVKDFALTNSQIGLINMAQTLGCGISCLVVSMLADKSGSGARKSWLIPFVVLSAIFSGLSAMTTSAASLMLVRVFFGISIGPVFPLMYASVNVRSSREKYAVHIAVVMIIMAIVSSMIGPVALTQAMARFTWKSAFLFISIPTLVIGMLLAAVVRDVSPTTGPEEGQAVKIRWSDFPRLLRYRNVILSSVLNLLTMGAMWIFCVFGPLYFLKVANMDEKSMGLLMAEFGLGSLVWSFFVPFVSNVIGRKPAAILFTLLSAVPFVALYYSTGPAAKILLVTLGGIIPVLTQLFIAIIGVESVPLHLRTTSAALVLCVGEVVGGAIVPGVVGKLADGFGSAVFMLCTALCMTAAFLLSFFLLETKPRAAEETPIVVEPNDA
jgi:predicted MFS family arabinose efflux permease